MKNCPCNSSALIGRSALIGLILLVVFPMGLFAESATPQEAGSIEITADRVVTDNSARTAEFSGNVTAIQGDTRITANRLILYYSGSDSRGERSAGGDIDKIEALGQVQIRFDNRVAVSEQAVYTTKDRKLILRGAGSKISEGRDEISGGEIIFDRDSEEVTINKGDQEDQVKAIIRSDQRGLN